MVPTQGVVKKSGEKSRSKSFYLFFSRRGHVTDVRFLNLFLPSSQPPWNLMEIQIIVILTTDYCNVTWF